MSVFGKKGATVAMHVFCQEDRILTDNIHESVLIDPLILESETGEVVHFSTLGRAAGSTFHAIVRGVLAGNVEKTLLLDIVDLGSPNIYHQRLTRGLIKAYLGLVTSQDAMAIALCLFECGLSVVQRAVLIHTLCAV